VTEALPLAAETSPAIRLRPYQVEAVNAVYDHLRTRDDNPCVVIPTAGGKTPVMATICRDAVQRWDGRVLILAHVKELLEQAVEKLHALAPDLWHRIGVYSAGLRSRDTEHPIIVAGIQSVYRRAAELDRFDLILIDEVHMIPPDGEGMYRTFLADARAVNPNVRLVGFTATPYRMTTGTICGPGHLLNHICYEIGVRELIVQGYLCPLRTKAGTQKPDCERLHVRGGEFIAGEVEQLMDDDVLVRSACREIMEYTQDRQSVLIFAAGIQHARHVQRALRELGQECGFVCGDTLPFERDETLRRFRSGDLKYLCNVNVLTTGFDAPNIDCVALLRPTNSLGLYYQMVGRAFRLHPGKADALVLDFGGNILRHGPVDQLRVSGGSSSGTGPPPGKECPECHEIIAAGYATCPACGHLFPPPERRPHNGTASSEGILSDQVSRTEYEVQETFYSVHAKRDAPPDAPRTMRVDYRIGFNHYVSEWVCFEHAGYARQRAVAWWRQRSHEPVPDTIEQAVELADMGALAPTLAITVLRKPGERYDRIVGYKLGEKPPRPESEDGLPEYAGAENDEVPF
jgi:DNA repair protein RadD